ncbi:MAG: hypothetical protein H6606_07390 [Flavobacteriales bacterium]|nr:hypothetical protein [Flavobacteriales bacterium]
MSEILNWISALSAIRNYFKALDSMLVDEKLSDLDYKASCATRAQSKLMYQRNYELLENFNEFDLSSIRPEKISKILKQSKQNSIVQIASIPIYVKPCFIYTFHSNGGLQLGAMWFIARLDGYANNELALFCEALYAYTVKHYARNFSIDKSHVTAVDIHNAKSISYDRLSAKTAKLKLRTIINKLKDS